MKKSNNRAKIHDCGITINDIDYNLQSYNEIPKKFIPKWDWVIDLCSKIGLTVDEPKAQPVEVTSNGLNRDSTKENETRITPMITVESQVNGKTSDVNSDKTDNIGSEKVNTELGNDPNFIDIYDNEELSVKEKVGLIGCLDTILDSNILVTNSGITFCSDKAFLSNMYPVNVKFKVQGDIIEFISNEQCFQYTKCVQVGEIQKANNIIGLKNPYHIKKIGDSVKMNKDNTWFKIERAILKQINRAKFSQNKNLLIDLLRTKEHDLIEATLCKKWGGAAILKDDVYVNRTFTGSNLFGKILMELRHEFLIENDMVI